VGLSGGEWSYFSSILAAYQPDQVHKGAHFPPFPRHDHHQSHFTPITSIHMFDMSKSKSLEESQDVAPLPVEAGEVGDSIDIQHDAVFGDITEDGPNYRNVGLSWTLLFLFMC
jgi:hypothetical protein